MSRRRFPDGISEEFTMRLINSSAGRNLFALQYCRDRSRQMMPLLFVIRSDFFAFGGQRVILAFPAVFGHAPFGLDLPLFLKLVQGGVKSALLELERIGAAAGGFLKNFIAVHFPSRQQMQQQ